MEEGRLRRPVDRFDSSSEESDCEFLDDDEFDLGSDYIDTGRKK